MWEDAGSNPVSSPIGELALHNPEVDLQIHLGYVVAITVIVHMLKIHACAAAKVLPSPVSTGFCQYPSFLYTRVLRIGPKIAPAQNASDYVCQSITIIGKFLLVYCREQATEYASVVFTEAGDGFTTLYRF